MLEKHIAELRRCDALWKIAWARRGFGRSRFADRARLYSSVSVGPPAPQLLAHDEQVARQYATLALYIRQCHAEGDL
jgi:hypothetical protein